MKMKIICMAILAVAACGSGSANAQISIENIRVRLPSGQYLTLSDGPERRWYNDRRLAGYHRYYYEPRQRAYIVYQEYDDDDRRYRPQPRWSNHSRQREHHWCPPGQAKKGRC